MTIDEHISQIRMQLCELKAENHRLDVENSRLARENSSLLDQLFDLEQRLQMYQAVPADHD